MPWLKIPGLILAFTSGNKAGILPLFQNLPLAVITPSCPCIQTVQWLFGDEWAAVWFFYRGLAHFPLTFLQVQVMSVHILNSFSTHLLHHGYLVYRERDMKSCYSTSLHTPVSVDLSCLLLAVTISGSTVSVGNERQRLRFVLSVITWQWGRKLWLIARGYFTGEMFLLQVSYLFRSSLHLFLQTFSRNFQRFDQL